MSNPLDYTFEYAEEKFIVAHEVDSASILDSEGDRVITIFNYALWPVDKAFPLDMAIMVVCGYNAGYGDGKKRGYIDAQYDMRKVLGL